MGVVWGKSISDGYLDLPDYGWKRENLKGQRAQRTGLEVPNPNSGFKALSLGTYLTT